jgi:hypothetical protein
VENKISANDILRIVTLFQSLNWEIDIDIPIESSIFNRFCGMIGALDLVQQALVLDLAKRFTVIRMPQYTGLLKKVIANIPVDKLEDNIILGPLIAPKDFKNEGKSSNVLAYACKTFEIMKHPRFVGKSFDIYPSIKVLTEKLKSYKDKEVSIILVDDYIGTGETAKNALNYLFSETNFTPDKFIVLSIACQKSGMKVLDEKGVYNMSYHILGKGISDFYAEPILSEYLTTMREIESVLNVSNDYKLGYGASEALISMSRTPNNTLPIFWWEPKGKNRLAPFPRN